MVVLCPVRAWHPNAPAFDADELVCPVYDTLSEEDVARYGRHPFNAAQFVPRPRSVALEAFLGSAAARLRSALREGAYVQDSRPAFYVYGIRYVPPDDIAETMDERQRRPEYLLLGLVGCIDLAETPPEDLALHERTFDDRVAERVALTDATRMQFAPIMAGYHQPSHRLNDLLEDRLGLDRRGLSFEGSHPALVEARLDGTTHRLWRMDDPDEVEEIAEVVRTLRLLVLDGHHRFTAASRRAAAGRASRPLTMLVNGRDRALAVLPWDRVLPRAVRSFPELLAAARREFSEVTPLPRPPSVDRVIARLSEMRHTGRRGFLASDGKEAFEVRGPPTPDAGADFDLLHSLLERSLRIDPHDLLFVRSPRQAFDRIASAGDPGGGGTALVLPGLTEQGIEERAFGSGAVMAHKSTMFLPKVAEGVIFAPADAPG